MKIIEKAVDVPREIPEDVAYVSIAPHLIYVWPALDKLGFDCLKVAGEMWRMRNSVAPDSSDSVWILYYGFHFLQPAINEKTESPCRPSWLGRNGCQTELKRYHPEKPPSQYAEETGLALLSTRLSNRRRSLTMSDLHRLSFTPGFTTSVPSAEH